MGFVLAAVQREGLSDLGEFTRRRTWRGRAVEGATALTLRSMPSISARPPGSATSAVRTPRWFGWFNNPRCTEIFIDTLSGIDPGKFDSTVKHVRRFPYMLTLV
jgi:hypothetical protein